MSVSPPKARDNLATAAARLSRAAPKSWEEVMEALTVLARQKSDDCVHAAADKVLIAQGKAQMCNELLTLFNDAAKQ